MLKLNNISKIYGSGEYAVQALKDISLEIKQGEFVAIVGPSGSGKTTLLALIGALLQPSSGSIYLNDTDLTQLKKAALTQIRLEHIGFVLQSANLIPSLRARDQLLLVSAIAKKMDKQAEAKADDLLESLGMSHRRNHYPEELSGGERQRVAIARALMNEPDIILADEPTANLDSKRGYAVVEMLSKEIKQRNTAGIMVTHDERMLDACDRVIRIEDGLLLN